MTVAFLFPGQGAQSVGMGRDVCESQPAAAELFDRAEQITDLPLRRLCFEGPEGDLARTDIAQPAIFTVSAAVLECMRQQLAGDMPVPAAAAGLSLGEYTALYAAGAMDFETGVKLVTRRGELMQQAATAAPSGMVSILGLDEQKASKLAEAAAQGQVLTCANFNCPGQVVLSGHADACKRAEQLAEKFGAKAAVPLEVAGAFHSRLMAGAAEKFAADLEKVELKTPDIPVLSNVDAAPHGQPEQIKKKLLDQLVSPVRWQQSMESLLADGAERFFEIGPGRVLAGLMRRIQRRVNFTCINSLETIDKLRESCRIRCNCEDSHGR